jgi:uncharacterized protein YbaR (Trm112 family)
MERDLYQLLCCPHCQSELKLHDETPEQPEVRSGRLLCIPCNIAYAIADGIPRIVSSDRLASRFWQKRNPWHRAACESPTGQESEQAFSAQTGFAPEDLRDKLVLHVGGGGGPFLDVPSRWGARTVVVDLPHAVEAVRQVVGTRQNVAIVQADAHQLPFRPETFDAIVATGLRPTTDDTEDRFLQLATLLKTGGDLAVWIRGRERSAPSAFWRAVLGRILPVSMNANRESRALDTCYRYSRLAAGGAVRLRGNDLAMDGIAVEG